MRITLFVYGSWGDLRPYVVLGKGLQAAGHEVQIAAPLDYEQWVRARKLNFYPISVNVSGFINDVNEIKNPLETLRFAREKLKPALVQMGLDIYEAMRNSDVLVTIEFGVSLLLSAMQAGDFKTIIVNPAPLNPTSEYASAALPAVPTWFPFLHGYYHLSHRLFRRTHWSLLAGARKDLNHRLGLPQGKFQGLQAVLAAAPTLTIVSPSVVPRPADWSEHWQVTGYLFDDDPDWTPPQDLVDFLAAGEAPVYIGFGSMADSKPERTTHTIIDAMQQCGKRAVILKGWGGLGAADLPETIHILKYAPHNWLFPQMGALVHHGGAGTTAAGLRAGVPATIVPHNGDQPYWGKMLHQLGVGADPIPRRKLSVETLSRAIQTMTSDRSMREKAQALSRRIQREDGLARAVSAINMALDGQNPST